MTFIAPVAKVPVTQGGTVPDVARLQSLIGYTADSGTTAWPITKTLAGNGASWPVPPWPQMTWFAIVARKLAI